MHAFILTLTKYLSGNVNMMTRFSVKARSTQTLCTHNKSRQPTLRASWEK